MSVRSANFSPRMGMKNCGLAVIIVPDGFTFNVWDFLEDQQREKILANLMNLLTIIDAQTCYP